MAKKKDQVSAEETHAGPVPVAQQEQAAKETREDTAEDVVELADLDDREFDEPGRISEEAAEEQGEILAAIALTPDMPGGDRAQDGPAFELARRDEAVAQGVVQTTQEKLWQLARQEEAEGQGVDALENTTQKVLFRQSRAEEVRAAKQEQAEHGVKSEPRLVGPEGTDAVTEVQGEEGGVVADETVRT